MNFKLVQGFLAFPGGVGLSEQTLLPSSRQRYQGNRKKYPRSSASKYVLYNRKIWTERLGIEIYML